MHSKALPLRLLEDWFYNISWMSSDHVSIVRENMFVANATFWT